MHVWAATAVLWLALSLVDVRPAVLAETDYFPGENIHTKVNDFLFTNNMVYYTLHHMCRYTHSRVIGHRMSQAYTHVLGCTFYYTFDKSLNKLSCCSQIIMNVCASNTQEYVNLGVHYTICYYIHLNLPTVS